MGWGNHVTLRTMITSLLMLSLEAHHDGADKKACGNLIPQHGSRQRDDTPPYYVQLSHTTYTPGVPITVTLSANRGDYFKGFLIQARISDMGPDFDTPVGTFTPANGTKLICPWDVGLTHTNDDPKSTLTLTWNPPDTLRGKIQFRTTFVESQYSYWVAQLSDILNEGQTTTSTTTTTTTTTPASSIQTQTTRSSDTVIRTTGATTVAYDKASTSKTTISSISSTPTVADGSDTMTSSLLWIFLGLAVLSV